MEKSIPNRLQQVIFKIRDSCKDREWFSLEPLLLEAKAELELKEVLPSTLSAFDVLLNDMNEFINKLPVCTHTASVGKKSQKKKNFSREYSTLNEETKPAIDQFVSQLEVLIKDIINSGFGSDVVNKSELVENFADGTSNLKSNSEVGATTVSLLLNRLISLQEPLTYFSLCFVAM